MPVLAGPSGTHSPKALSLADPKASAVRMLVVSAGGWNRGAIETRLRDAFAGECAVDWTDDGPTGLATSARVPDDVDNAPRLRLERELDRLNALQAQSYRFMLRSCHDIRSPLAVIKTYASILLAELADSTDADHVRFFQTITRRVDDVANMLDSILDASALASDVIGARREPTSIGRMLDEMSGGLREMAAAKGAQLHVVVPSLLPDVFCDRGNIRRAIQSLVAHASLAGGAGARIELSAVHEREDASVRIAITDNRRMAAEPEVAVGFDTDYQPEAGADMATREDLELHVIREIVRINLGCFSALAGEAGGLSAAFTLPLVDLEGILVGYLGVLRSERQTVGAVSLLLITAASPARQSAVGWPLWRELRACDLVVPLAGGDCVLVIPCGADEIDGIAKRLATALVGDEEQPGEDASISIAAIGTWDISVAASEMTEAIRCARLLQSPHSPQAV